MDEMKLIVMCHDKVILLSVPTKHSLLGIYVKYLNHPFTVHT